MRSDFILTVISGKVLEGSLWPLRFLEAFEAGVRVMCVLYSVSRAFSVVDQSRFKIRT